MDVNQKIQSFWPDWKIKEEVGRGAFGIVYRAERYGIRNNYNSAIKIISIPYREEEMDLLRSEGLRDGELTTYFGGMITECADEISVLEKLKGHSNIVSIEDFKIIKRDEVFGWDIFIRMEFLESLPEYIQSKPDGLSREEIIKLGTDLCEALSFCEKERIIHRDIKLSNIFVASHNRFKLGDFGIAKTLEKSTRMFSRKGTQSYMAPEVFRGERYLPNVDIYSLGLVLYQLLNNNCLPFMNSSKTSATYAEREEAFYKRIRGDALPRPACADNQLAEVILKACSYDPDKRFGKSSEFREALIKAAGTTEETKNPEKRHGVSNRGDNLVFNVRMNNIETGNSGTNKSVIEKEDSNLVFRIKKR